ncbi:MAG: ATP-binding protein [Flavobacteriaceae bacterium]
MHALLKRQIRKYLTEELASSEVMEPFFRAVENAYRNNDQKLEIIQRSTLLSSEELSQANAGLKKEVENQKKILKSLQRAIKAMNGDADEQRGKGEDEFDPDELTGHIQEQAKKLIGLTAEKNKLLNYLEQQNESLNNYAHMVSHDLKSPIRNINALIHWISEAEYEKFSADSKENFSLVSKNLTKIDNLINGILEHATIEQREEDKIPVQLSRLLTDIKDTTYVPQNVIISFPEDLPVIFAQEYPLQQLFTNLLANAINAIPEDRKGRIDVRAEDRSEFWEFSISDNGKGIAEKHQTTIFEMFRKLENDSGTSGIGLALVKKIINMFQGKIWLTSKIDEGTTFYFTLKKNDHGDT